MGQEGSTSRNEVCFIGDFCLAGEDLQSVFRPSSFNPSTGLRRSFCQDVPIIANLECALTHEHNGLPLKWANLKASPELHWTLDGVSLAVLGNNHIGDFGHQGAKHTQSLLASKNISCVGYGGSLNEALKPRYVDLCGNKLGVVSLCCPTTNGENLATHLTPGVAPLGMATLKQAVEGARSQCDALVVYLHWGCEWVHDPAPDQLRMVRHTVDCGADAVIGSHSHTIQSFERYRGRWIFYSLGNYLFKAGYAQAVGDNGELERIPLSLKQANRESLAVSFHVVPDSGAGRLPLDRVQPMYFDEDLEPRAIGISDLTFDLEAANGRLSLFATRHGIALRDRNEPLFRACLLNGSALAYWYNDETIADQSSRIYDFFIDLWRQMSENIYPRLKRITFHRI